MFRPGPGILSLPIYLIAAIGIWRGRVWSAYGVAILLSAGLITYGIGVMRSGATQFAPWIAAILVLLAMPFGLAGRSLSRLPGPRGTALPWIVLASLVSAASILLQALIVPTGSMENTLQIGDRILVWRVPGTKPARGNVIAFRYPIDHSVIQLKRVVGLPGDHVKIVNKQLFVNSSPTREGYAIHTSEYVDPYRDFFPSTPAIPLATQAREMLNSAVVDGELIVPQGSYFVLGDNRDASFDSRYWGFVPNRDVIGKALMIYWSENTLTEKQPPLVHLGANPMESVLDLAVNNPSMKRRSDNRTAPFSVFTGPLSVSPSFAI